MRLYRLLFIAALTAVLLTGVVGCGAGADVAARVNGTEIGIAEVDDQVAALRESSPQMFEGEEGEARVLELRRSILEGLIDTILIRQASEERGIAVTDEEVEAQVTTLREGLPTQEEFDTALASARLTLDELRERLRDELVMQRLMEEVIGATEVEPADVQAYYEANPDEFTEPAGARASHILFAPEDRALAEQILAEIRGGGDFAALARENSIDEVSATQGGDLGWSDPDRPFVPEFTAAMDALEAGEVSDLVETESGWHIIQVNERREEQKRAFADVTEEIEQAITRERNNEAYQAFMQELRAAATIEYLVDDLRPVETP